MGNFKQGLKQFVVNNPEEALEILHEIIISIPKVIKAGVAIKNEGVCNYVERKIENLFSKKEENYVLPVYTTTERTTPAYSVFSYSMMPQIDYGDQIETLLPVVCFVFDFCKGNNVSWSLGTAENRYISSFYEDDTCYSCLVELSSSGPVILDVLAKEENHCDEYLSIGEYVQPIHPDLNRKLSDLFFMAEDNALKNCNNKNCDSALNKNDIKIARFLDDLIKITNNKVAKWKPKTTIGNSYAAVINKKSGDKIIIEFIRRENSNIEVRVAQLVDNKFSKLLHVKNQDFDLQVEVKMLLKRLESEIIGAVGEIE